MPRDLSLSRRDFNRLALCAAAAFPLRDISLDATHHSPRFPSLWSEVDAYILTEWKKMIVKSDGLPQPFIQESPGWNFMFYWDNYFMNLGLLRLRGYEYLAKNATDNLLSLVERYGFVPNCSLSWGTNRSQPPYLSQMVREVYQHTRDKAWLRAAYGTLRKEYRFWMDQEQHPIERHHTAIPGLQRYSHHASREDSLVFYRDVLSARFGYPQNVSDDEKLQASDPYITEAATGMDFTPRFEHRCHEFAALDLNVLLYLLEVNLGWIVSELGLAGEPDWKTSAEKRRGLIQKYFWDESRGFFYDYDFVNRRHSRVACCTGFMPMWAGIATPRQSARMLNALPLFEYEWGLACCEKTGQARHYQWDFPNGWVPHQALVMLALDRAGFREDAVRVASKYLDLVAKNFDKPVPAIYKDGDKQHTRVRGRMYEKYEVVSGNIADTEYPAFEGLSWTAGVYVFAHDLVRRPGA